MAAPLSRRVIIDAAISYIDRYGLERLTMRRLGAELSVEAMALYRYLPSREQLLNAILEALVDDLFEEPNLSARAASWQEYLSGVAENMRNLAIKHPRIFPLICSKPTQAPWIRPPLRSLRWVEHMLGTLKEFGFSDSQAVETYKAVTSFLIGSLLLHSASAVPAEVDPASVTPVPWEDYPLVARNRERLAQDTSAREFSDGMDELLERLRLSVATPGPVEL